MSVIKTNDYSESTIWVSRKNVREIEVEINTGIMNTMVRLTNETAREMVEEIINLIGMEVVIPVKPKAEKPD